MRRKPVLVILMKTLPFVAVIGLGYLAARTRFFTEEATACQTRFVFCFAMSAMLFGFAATLNLAAVFSWAFVGACLTAFAMVWALVGDSALLRGTSPAEAVVEAPCAVIGNVGFPGIPMLALLIGPAAALPVAGNVFILAQHYHIAPQRVSTAILFSTIASVVSVTAVIALVTGTGEP